MELERFAAMLDAYGAAPERWPAHERGAAESLLASNAEAQALHQKADAMDRTIDRFAVAPAGMALADAIARHALATPQERPFSIASWLTDVLGGPPLWPRLAGFAAALVVGLGIGFTDLGLGLTQADARENGEITLFDNSIDDALL